MHVAIFGGGVAGMPIANTLFKTVPRHLNLQVTLVDPKPYMEVNWASVRSMFDESMRHSHILSRDEWIKEYSVSFICAKLISLSQTSATLDNNETISFDIAIVAVGSHTQTTILHPENPVSEVKARCQDLYEEGEKLLSAKSILIIGGGGIGCDFAGDIATFASHKKNAQSHPQITLVHSNAHLIPELSDSAGAKMNQKIQSLGVKVILNDRAEEKDGKWVLEKTGEAIEADIVIKSIGVYPHNDFMKQGGLEDTLDEKGWIKTNEFFRVPGTNGRIFAVGDCSTTHAKKGSTALANKPIVAHNVKLSLLAISEKKNLDQLSDQMKPKTEVNTYVATAGPQAGVAMTALCNDTFFLPWLKNRTMFIFKVKSEAGL